jgi:purine-nucleoside/S-methyl-5'-thioadenosine phosphorylase / adenosine deaminase
MLILKSSLLSRFHEVIFGFSTKIGADRKSPYFFNLSHSVEDDEQVVKENRELFFNSLGLGMDSVALQKQIHSSIVTYVDRPGVCSESDAMITDKVGLGLAISTADCTPIFIFDKKNKIIAGVHSGWRGTEKKILLKTLDKLKEEFNSSPEDLIAYLGPSISQENYEVGGEVAEKFDEKYLKPAKEKFLLDVAHVNYDILINFGLKSENIQASGLCNYKMKNLLHSYRRDGKNSGRALGVIALKDN